MNFSDALQLLEPTAQFYTIGEDYSGITRTDGLALPTEQALIDAWNARPTYKKWSSLEFLQEFTDTEWLAIKALADTIPPTQYSVIADRFKTYAIAAEFIDNSNPLFTQGIGFLRSVGILTQERANYFLGV